VNLSIVDFTEEDLKSNQRGFISKKQKEMLDNYASGIRATQRSTAKVAFIFPVLGLCMILAISFSNESARTALFSNVFNIIVLAVLLPFVVVIFAVSIYFADRRAKRLQTAELLKVEGKVKLDESHSSKVGSAYYVIINKVKFVFPEDVSEIFQENSIFRIYYCTTSMLKIVLSYEKLG